MELSALLATYSSKRSMTWKRMPHAFTTGAGCGSAAVRSADKCCDDEKNKMIMAQRPKNLLAFISIKETCISAGTPGAFLREYLAAIVIFGILTERLA
jgi:hypothetical protein